MTYATEIVESCETSENAWEHCHFSRNQVALSPVSYHRFVFLRVPTWVHYFFFCFIRYVSIDMLVITSLPLTNTLISQFKRIKCVQLKWPRWVGVQSRVKKQFLACFSLLQRRPRHIYFLAITNRDLFIMHMSLTSTPDRFQHWTCCRHIKTNIGVFVQIMCQLKLFRGRASKLIISLSFDANWTFRLLFRKEETGRRSLWCLTTGWSEFEFGSILMWE